MTIKNDKELSEALGSLDPHVWIEAHGDYLLRFAQSRVEN